MEHFYDGQIKRYLTQFMRLMSSFGYKDAKGKVVQIPVRYGDMNRMVAQIMNKNSENVIQSAPFISCYIKNLAFDRERLQDPTFVSKVNIRERAYDEQGQEYLNIQGNNYTIERLMPVPFKLQFNADIWTTNTDQKLQLLEQILVLFNPALEIQTNSNYVDWTSLSFVELTGVTFSSRSIPQGIEQDVDIATLQFDTPIWITTPAKVKKLGVITKIITNILDGSGEDLSSKGFGDSISDENFLSDIAPMATVVTTLGNYSLLVLDNTAKLIPPGSDGTRCENWYTILDQYPGKFTADYSTIRITKENGTELVGYLAQDPSDDTIMLIRWDPDTRPADTLLTSIAWPDGYGRVDAIINPHTFNPNIPQAGVRYLILEDIRATVNDGPTAWLNQGGTQGFSANTNDIIEWSGSEWQVIFNSQDTTDSVYITNQRTLIQYSWDGESWLKSVGGIYTNAQWRLVL